VLRDAMVTTILGRLGARTDLQSLVETEVLYVQETVLEGHPWLPWFLTTETASTPTVAGEESVAVPTGFLQEMEGQSVWLIDPSDDVTPLELKKDEYDILLQRYPGTGQPQAYALRGDFFMLRPTPDDIYTLRMRYFGRAPLLSSNIENVWSKHAADVFIAETCLLVAEEHIKDYESAERFRTMVQRGWDRLNRMNVARAEAGAMREMGDD
jgi:hypothetical protein